MTDAASLPLRRGKHLPTYTPSMDMGGYVVIINCEQVLSSLAALTMRKQCKQTSHCRQYQIPLTAIMLASSCLLVCMLLEKKCETRSIEGFRPGIEMTRPATQVVVTGNKFNDKLYRRHTTGRPGSMKIERFKDLQAVSRVVKLVHTVL